jgi:hypothetical protein
VAAVGAPGLTRDLLAAGGDRPQIDCSVPARTTAGSQRLIRNPYNKIWTPVMSEPKPSRWQKRMNKVVIAINKFGIPVGPAMVLTVPGRKTGKPRSTPMTPFTLDGQLYTVGRPGARLGTKRASRRQRSPHPTPQLAASRYCRAQSRASLVWAI